jgi:arginyl-tRNA synthetase
MPKYKLKECKNFKKYKAKRKPTCGCEACNVKFIKLSPKAKKIAKKIFKELDKQERKVIVEKIEVIELDAKGQKLADKLSEALRKRRKKYGDI